VNVTSLKEYDYFTYARADGKALKFSAPTDYWLEYKNAALTLHFTLPLIAPIAAKATQIEIYDPTIFVDFEFAKDKPALLTEPRHLALGDAAYAHSLHQIVDRAGGDALSPSRDIPFNKLVLSQSNVRRVKAGVSIEQLAGSIAQRTLLQRLNVRASWMARVTRPASSRCRPTADG
jgi:hypothetical protein